MSAMKMFEWNKKYGSMAASLSSALSGKSPWGSSWGLAPVCWANENDMNNFLPIPESNISLMSFL